MSEREEVCFVEKFHFLVGVFDELFLNLKHLISFNESIFLQLFVLCFVLAFLKHTLLLYFHFIFLFLEIVIFGLLLAVSFLLCLSFYLLEHIVVTSVLENNSLCETIATLSFDERLQEWVRESRSIC